MPSQVLRGKIRNIQLIEKKREGGWKPDTQNKREESLNQTKIFSFIDIKYNMQQKHMNHFVLKK